MVKIKMGKTTIILTQENENQIRIRNRKKGDISNTINQALEQYFKKVEQ